MVKRLKCTTDYIIIIQLEVLRKVVLELEDVVTLNKDGLFLIKTVLLKAMEEFEFCLLKLLLKTMVMRMLNEHKIRILASKFYFRRKVD